MVRVQIQTNAIKISPLNCDTIILVKLSVAVGIKVGNICAD